MSDLDSRIRQLLHEMTDTAPPARDLPGAAAVVTLHDRRPSRRAVAVVAAIVVFVVGGILWRLAGGDDEPGTVDVVDDIPTENDFAPPGDLASLGPDEWPFPTLITDELTYGFAMVISPGRRQVVFGNDDNTATLGILVDQSSAVTEPNGETQVLGGVTWLVSPIGNYFTETASGWITLTGQGVADDLVAELVASLTAVEASALPRLPLDLVDGTYVEVASAREGDALWILSVQSDGHVFASTTSSDGGFGGASCCAALDAGEVLRTHGWSSGEPTEVGSSSIGLIEGLVSEQVAMVEFHLRDGSLIQSVPQDTSGAFNVDFLFVAIPGTSPNGAIDQVIARDAQGDELGRMEGGSGVIRQREPIQVGPSSTPSQSPDDAARDGIIPEIAELSFAARVMTRSEAPAAEGIWLLTSLSREVEEATWDTGCGLGDLDGVYPVDLVCAQEYGEILLVDDGRSIVRAFPMPGAPPSWIHLSDSHLYAGHIGDGGLPSSTLVRIDRATFEAVVVVDTVFEDGVPANEWLPTWYEADGEQEADFASAVGFAPEASGISAISWIGDVVIDLDAIDRVIEAAAAS